MSNNDNEFFFLMHNDDIVTIIRIDLLTGSIMDVNKKYKANLLPIFCSSDPNQIKLWWQRRAVPNNRENIELLLKRNHSVTNTDFLVKNLGLSLTDHYWIKPCDSELTWDEVNLFENDFVDEKYEDKQQINHNMIPYSPGASTQGDQVKQWIILNNKRYLRKKNHFTLKQQCINEVFASLMHKKQGKFPYVNYELTSNAEGVLCECFTSIDVEFIPAIDIISYTQKDNESSVYDHFVNECCKGGLDEKYVRSFLEYQMMTDFVISNTDRHFNNFGILRDTHTLKFLSMAPIFDSGNSMYWDMATKETPNLLRIKTNSFCSNELSLLKHVLNRESIDLDKLPTTEELREIYEKDRALSKQKIDMISMLYEKKKELTEDFIQGKSIYSKESLSK